MLGFQKGWTNKFSQEQLKLFKANILSALNSDDKTCEMFPASDELTPDNADQWCRVIICHMGNDGRKFLQERIADINAELDKVNKDKE